MLLIPFFSAAILARDLHWAELAALLAAFCTFAAKDPLVVLARQRWIWKQRRPETDAAKPWLVAEAFLLAGCAIALMRIWPIWILAIAGIGALGFSALAVYVNVKNRQRSTLFQIVSAIMISSTSVAACLSATGAIKPWCWWLWMLCAIQAAAGILVVHARLEARKAKPNNQWRRPALIAALALLVAALCAALLRQPWITAALALAGAGYLYDLRRQQTAASLRMPLTLVGIQTMSLSILYALLIIGGLW